MAQLKTISQLETSIYEGFSMAMLNNQMVTGQTLDVYRCVLNCDPLLAGIRLVLQAVSHMSYVTGV
jgi:hypothetical protein